MVARSTAEDTGLEQQFTLTPQERKLIKQKWFAEKGKEQFYEEFVLFALNKRLSPLVREVMPLFFWDDRNRQFRMTPYTSIDGMRKIADRSGNYAGSDDYLYDGECSLHDWLSQYDGNPKTATVTVYKMVKGIRCPFTASAAWDTYYPGTKKPNWNKKGMSIHMLGKCAESLALSKAFPSETAGLYISEEMDQAQSFTPERSSEPANKPAQYSRPVAHVVATHDAQEENPEVPSPPNDLDRWSDGTYFKNAYYGALKARNIPEDKAAIIAGAEARVNKIKSYKSATPAQRKSLVERVKGGNMDGFRDLVKGEHLDEKATGEPAGEPNHPAADSASHEEDENWCIKFWMGHVGVEASDAMDEMDAAIARTTKSKLTFADMSAEQMSTWRKTLEKHGEKFAEKWHNYFIKNSAEKSNV